MRYAQPNIGKRKVGYLTRSNLCLWISKICLTTVRLSARFVANPGHRVRFGCGQTMRAGKPNSAVQMLL